MYGFGAGEAISPDGKQLTFNAELNLPDNPQQAASKLALVTLDEKLAVLLPPCFNPIPGWLQEAEMASPTR